MFYFALPKGVSALIREGKRVVNVSSKASPPYCFLSPFFPHGDIPVPGMKGVAADSVEGVWQGLKSVRGRIDESFFHGPGKKRRSRAAVEGHRYGDRLLSYGEARNLIYVPLYRHMVTSLPLARDAAFGLLLEGLERDVWVHDVDSNGDIANLTKPLAHAAVLVELLNENLVVCESHARDANFRKAFDADALNGAPRYPLAEMVIKQRRKEVR